MPQRTNPFQTLMTQINAALHGKKAKVEESPMVYNYDLEKEVEIDILISFEVGGNTYRTAIECQNRSRSSGPSWITDLKAKREGCRLDKIIAIHSKGFTQPAKTLALKYGIETLTPKEIKEGEDLFETIKPFTKMAFQIMNCIFPEGILLCFKEGSLPKKAEPDSSNLIFPDNSIISIDELQKELRKIVSSIWMEKEYGLTGKIFNEDDEKEIHDNILVEVSFPNGAKLKFTDGTCLSAISAKAEGKVTVKTVRIEKVKHTSPKNGVLATHAEFEVLGKKANVALTQKEDNKGEMGICIGLEGGTIKGKTKIDKRLIGNIELMIKKL